MKVTRLVIVLSLFAAQAVSEDLPEKVILASPIDFLPVTISRDVLNVAYQRAGIAVEYVVLPAKRSVVQVNQGLFDGEVSRIWSITDTYPNLIRVPTPINYINQVLYSNRDLKVNSCEALAGFSVGVRRGVKHAEVCSQHAGQVNVFNKTDRMMKVLSEGRIDLVITSRLSGLPFEDNKDYPHVTLLEPPLSHIHLYHFLHKSNADLVNKLDAELSKMEQSGEIETIRNQTIANYMKRLNTGALKFW
ncbi:substrate-binding periplasmic protein [Vibrio sp. SCSIO 43137]|uniref:substrate-binding periplasmic protein n=1 Tax=Vibrio sp. SCSIO 43137 TaxID=3021011 RepID=UPI0023082B67|nr:transporter substrate-binding domain-containing protein [Vibrio sp. SCSIO 43137]WCE32416.1 transporter substrate-binding domain-containing protein [Vibrio sp. SCSIO 43137]